VFGLLGYLTSPIGLISLALLVLCVVHAIRTGNIFPWIYVIVFLPSVGPLIYFFMVIVPGLMRSRGVHRIGSGVARAVDPNKDYREAVRAADVVGSIDSKRALAEHYVQRGRTDEAIEIYQSMLQGQFKDDPVLLLGLARAQFQKGDGAGAQTTLDALQAADPKFVSQEAHMIYARALEMQGKNEDAAAEYEKLARYASGEEARARYAMCLGKLGRRDEARAIYAQIVKNLDGAPRRYRSDQAEWGSIAKAALKS
jgi:pentatricopeptide repeat protein